MRELSLFTGAGGGILGSKLLGWKTVGYVEFNDYCQRVIRQRIEDGIIDNAPIFGDIRAFNSEGYANCYKGMVDVITGGFPCQPFSTAAHGNNTAESLWPEMFATIYYINPNYVFAENVKKSAIEHAAEDLHSLGYTSRGLEISAKYLGCDHVRRRYWLFAYSNNKSKLSSKEHAKVVKLQKFCNSFWQSFPGKSGVADGLDYRMERFKAIGNGQIPLMVASAWEIVSEGLV